MPNQITLASVEDSLQILKDQHEHGRMSSRYGECVTFLKVKCAQFWHDDDDWSQSDAMACRNLHFFRPKIRSQMKECNDFFYSHMIGQTRSIQFLAFISSWYLLFSMMRNQIRRRRVRSFLPYLELVGSSNLINPFPCIALRSPPRS